jgi:hypothetical protein
MRATQRSGCNYHNFDSGVSQITAVARASSPWRRQSGFGPSAGRRCHVGLQKGQVALAAWPFLFYFARVNRRFLLFVTVALCAGGVRAEDEKSIGDLRDALIALSPRTVDPREAELLSVTAHTMSRQLAREYGVTGDPAIHNYLIHIGVKKKGICADYTRDIGAKLKEFHFKTLTLHWGAAFAKESEENNALVVTARNQSFLDGVVLDGWRRAGRLFWCRVQEDHEYEAGRHGFLGHLGGHAHTGITAWKEDLQETAWLQQNPPVKPEPGGKRYKPGS